MNQIFSNQRDLHELWTGVIELLHKNKIWDSTLILTNPDHLNHLLVLIQRIMGGLAFSINQGFSPNHLISWCSNALCSIRQKWYKSHIINLGLWPRIRGQEKLGVVETAITHHAHANDPLLWGVNSTQASSRHERKSGQNQWCLLWWFCWLVLADLLIACYALRLLQVQNYWCWQPRQLRRQLLCNNSCAVIRKPTDAVVSSSGSVRCLGGMQCSVRYPESLVSSPSGVMSALTAATG